MLCIAISVALYGLILFAGLVCLATGPGAWDSFLGFLRSPISVLLHIAIFLAVVYHVKTWFETLPKTMPKMIVGGKQVPAAEITRKAQIAAGCCSLALLIVVVVWVAR